jgi:hypothetical protein
MIIIGINGGRYRDRTYDHYDVKVNTLSMY